jgi:hypothetical protein
MTKSRFFLPLVLLCACTQAAVEEPPIEGDEALSGPIATDDMAASISAEQYAPGETIRVYAALFHKGKYVTLSDGDELYVTLGNGRAVMLRQTHAEDGVVRYMTGLRPEGGAATLNVSLVRPEGKVSAMSSTIAVPAPFEIASKVPAQVYPGDQVEVKLAPAPQLGAVSESMEAHIDGACLEKKSVRKVALVDGQVKVPLDGLRLKGEGGCQLAVQIRHVVQRPVDTRFAQSFLPTTDGVQARTFVTKLVR